MPVTSTSARPEVTSTVIGVVLSTMRTTSRCVGGAAPPPPWSAKRSASWISTASRASAPPFGASIGAISMAASASRTFGAPPATGAVPYIGWKQPAVSSASAATMLQRKPIRPIPLRDHIHDPLRHDDDLLRRLAVQRAPDCFEF